MSLSEEIILLLVGGAIGLLSAIVMAVIQHKFGMKLFEKQLQAQREQYQRQLDDERKQRFREQLLRPDDPRKLRQEREIILGQLEEIEEWARAGRISFERKLDFARDLEMRLAEIDEMIQELNAQGTS